MIVLWEEWCDSIFGIERYDMCELVSWCMWNLWISLCLWEILFMLCFWDIWVLFIRVCKFDLWDLLSAIILYIIYNNVWLAYDCLIRKSVNVSVPPLSLTHTHFQMEKELKCKFNMNLKIIRLLLWFNNWHFLA